MGLSLAGILVCTGLFLLALILRSPLILGLFASLPFGSTAIATFGVSSPLIFTVFAVALLMRIALSRNFLRDLVTVIENVRAAQIVCALAVYAVVSAILLPRLFAGSTTAHLVLVRRVVEVPLGPTGGNVAQTAYLVLGTLIFLAFCLLLFRGHWETIERGFFTLAAVHAALGVVDIGFKVLGVRDVLEPVRSAGYALLAEVMEEGFWRIVGGYAEASTFAANTLPSLAFTFSYWRITGSRPALILSFILFGLLIFSTSTTGYVGFAIVLVLFLGSIAIQALQGRLRARDVLLIAFIWVGLGLGCAAFLYSEHLFQPFVAMIDVMVLEKASSSSGLQRAYWNEVAIRGFFDTYGLGIGMGSSRSSSWVISVISQLGVIGVAMFAILLWELVRPVRALESSAAARRFVVLGESARAATIAWLAAISVSFGSADPGLIFFIGLATVVCCRERLSPVKVAVSRPYPRPALTNDGGP